MASSTTITEVTGEFLFGAMIDICLLTIPALLETSNSTTHRLRQWDPIFYRGELDRSLISIATSLIQVFTAWRTSRRIEAVAGVVAICLLSYAWTAARKFNSILSKSSERTDDSKKASDRSPVFVAGRPYVSKTLPFNERSEEQPAHESDSQLKEGLVSRPVAKLLGKSEPPINARLIDSRPTAKVLSGNAERSAIVCWAIEAPHTGTIAVVEIQRPEAKNAISRQMLQELEEVMDQIHEQAATHQVRALVVASSVNDAFCAGADLKERRRMSIEETQQFLKQLRRTLSKLAALPIPTIASVSGIALGGGLELALCCHFRIFSSNAAVGLPETKLAIIPGAGGTFRLRNAVGLSNALDIILTGRRVKSAEAFRIGLCNRLVEGDEGKTGDLEWLRNSTLEMSLSLAKEIASGGPVAICAALSAVVGGNEEAENAAYDVVLGTQDRAQALERFGTKQPLEFTGS